jgi:hypothetical protein
MAADPPVAVRTPPDATGMALRRAPPAFGYVLKAILAA